MEPEASQSEHVPLLQQLLSGVLAITTASGESCGELSLRLFTIILRVSASKHFAELRDLVSIVITCTTYIHSSSNTFTSSLRTKFGSFSPASSCCYSST